MPRESSPGFNPEKKEFGGNVSITLKIMRHGEREGLYLNDLGRQQTANLAELQKTSPNKYDAVKAVGSPADTDPKTHMGRALETAHIYAQTLTDNNAFRTRPEELLNYKNLVSKRPYDHIILYNSYLPEDFKALSPEEKSEASKVANRKVLEHLISLNDPDAVQYKKEVTGAYALLVEHYIKMAKRLKSGSNVLIPIGGHGSNMEFLLLEAAVKEGQAEHTTAFKNLNDLGGDFDPSEAYNIEVKTDTQGNTQPLKVTFDNPKRGHADIYLDNKKMEELVTFYKQLHPKP